MDCFELWPFLIAIAVIFIGACFNPRGFDPTHRVCSTVVMIAGGLAALVWLLSQLEVC